MIPAGINLHTKSATLELVYDEGKAYTLTAEYLRVFSPSAEVRGHGPGQSVLQYGKRDVRIRDVEPQGNYALKLTFSDGHDSGIYSWDYLYQLATGQDRNWQDYLDQLEAAGKTRTPQFIAVDRL